MLEISPKKIGERRVHVYEQIRGSLFMGKLTCFDGSEDAYLQQISMQLFQQLRDNQDHERRLRELEKKIETQQALLDDREQALDQWREALQKREEACGEQQKEQAEALGQAIERYQSERSLWDSHPSHHTDTHYAQIEEYAKDLRSHLSSVRQTLDTVCVEVTQMSRTVRDGDMDGVDALCKLYRDLCCENNWQAADRLSAILQARFGAEVLEPVPGAQFDAITCERIDQSVSGDQIRRCVARGWRWKDRVILRAVVEIIA